MSNQIITKLLSELEVHLCFNALNHHDNEIIKSFQTNFEEIIF